MPGVSRHFVRMRRDIAAGPTGCRPHRGTNRVLPATRVAGSFPSHSEYLATKPARNLILVLPLCCDKKRIRLGRQTWVHQMTSTPEHYREGRLQLEDILHKFDLNVFEWLCLEASTHWAKWDSPVAESIYRDVVIENFWRYGNCGSPFHPIYLPDITRDVLDQADASICSSGLICRVERPVAELMIAERIPYDDNFYSTGELVGLRVLTDSGRAVWESVRGLQGYWSGFRLITLLSKQHNSYTPTGLVFHLPHEFHIELLCDICATETRALMSPCFAKVGPWFDQNGCQVWLDGWRLICQHAV